MSFRGWLVVILLVAAGFGGYWLYTNVPLFGLVVNDGQQWQMLAQGWQTFYQGWLFVVPGIVIACLICVPITAWLYAQAENADHEWELSRQKHSYALRINGLEERLYKANERAENAESKARSLYQSAITEAEERTQQALAEIEKGRSMQAKAIEHAKQSMKEVEKVTQEARRATKKKNNAMAAAERIKRREARLQGV
jgi:CRISPR/Cas system CMR-associated protein Cmr5 small subunit